ncbi:MAG: hypothetical protein IK012_03635 [Fibrobacter sp.]|uniref:hypothetical protein n=1 Tax=Fibrobacter sp. TaxID=35828 RepID=UPI0025BFB080|nr:hypothetical protein [Fibrobacter sp.]MBR4784328.1 hypothetical protein [Fibrobacter sp.]
MKGKLFMKMFAALACASVFFLGGCSMVDYEIEEEGHVWRFVGLVDDSTALVKVTLEQRGEEHDHHLFGWDDDFHKIKETKYYYVGMDAYRIGLWRDSTSGTMPEERETDEYGLRLTHLDDYSHRCGLILLDKKDNDLDTLENIYCDGVDDESAKLVGSYVKVDSKFYLVEDGKFPRQKPTYRYEHSDWNIKFVDANGDFLMYGGKP